MPSYSSVIFAHNPPPIVYYRLDESSGVQAFDSSGNGYTAMLSGSVLFNQVGAIPGESDTSLFFGASGMLTLPSTLSRAMLTWGTASLEFLVHEAGEPFWKHVALTTNGIRTLLYLNGMLTPSLSGQSLWSGRFLDSLGSSVAISLDEVVIHNYELSPAQLTLDIQAAGLSPLVSVPLTSSPSSFAGVGGVLPLLLSEASYGVSSVPLPDQPVVCTTPLSATSGTIPIGDVVFLLFSASVSGTTRALFTSGNVLFLTFATLGGKMVTGQVIVTSSALASSTFQVTCTTLAPIAVSSS